jgi:hypothetical protein
MSHRVPITDLDQRRVVELLASDLHATIGAAHDDLLHANAVRLRAFEDDAESYSKRVIEDTQQDIHDEFIDTCWPKCPNHAHPLWFRDGAWWCNSAGRRVAALGGLTKHSA